MKRLLCMLCASGLILGGLSGCKLPKPQPTLSAGPVPGLMAGQNPALVPVGASSSGKKPDGSAAVNSAGPITPVDRPRDAGDGEEGARFKLAECYALLNNAGGDLAAQRFLPLRYQNLGAVQIVEDEVMPLYKAGWRRFMIDSPMGREAGADGAKVRSFFGALRGTPASAWRVSFVEGWKQATTQPEISVIAYLGNPTTDAEYRAIAQKPEAGERALLMLDSAVQPLLDAGFAGIAVDSAADLSDGSPLAELFKQLRAKGKEVFVNGEITLEGPGLDGVGSIRSAQGTVAAKGAPGKDGAKAAKPANGGRGGDRIQIADGTPPFDWAKGQPFDRWGRRWIAECLRNGERPAFAPAAAGDVRALGLD